MYGEFRPSEALQPWVAAYWRRDGAEGTTRVLPDGCADIIFDIDRGEVSVVGTMTRPLVVESANGRNLFGVRFRPGRLSSLLPIPLREITDAIAPLGDISQRLELRVESIDQDLRRLVGESDRRVDAAVRMIIRSGGRCDINRVAQSVGATRQHLARLFALHVGVSPKMFARVIRFRHALRLGRTQPWADVAARLGYADQSHLIAEFREFSGSTPVPFFLSREDDAA
jgi:AraC-like DNA-binding protein